MLLHMTESFKPKQEGKEGPADPSRRRFLNIATATTMATVAVCVGEGLENINNTQVNESTGVPPPTPESINTHQSTQPEMLNKLIEALKSGNQETFTYALKYVDGLREEKSALLKRKNTIIGVLANSNDTNPLQPFYLLEHDRIDISLHELDTHIQTIERLVRQSLLYDMPKGATESGGSAESSCLPESVRERKLFM